MALSAVASRRDAAADAPCRDVGASTGEPTPAHRRQSPFRQDPPKTQTFRTRDAFHRQGPPRPTALPRDHGITGWVVTIPRLGRRGPPLDMVSRQSARPARVRLFTGGDAPHAAYRLLQQIRTTNTPVGLPDLDLCGGENSSPIERLELPCGRRTDRGSSAQGLRSNRYATPVECDRSPRRIDPDLIGPDTSCRRLVRRRGLEGLTESPLR